jgi:hypothetical protein
MATVMRYDRATLRRARMTSQGFLRAEGLAARAGIYEYHRADGSIQRELRPIEEVQHPDSLASYDAAPVTDGHPVNERGEHVDVDSTNVAKYDSGTVMGEGKPDEDHVAADLVIKRADTIAKVKAGKQELSPGYKIRLDQTAGADKRYAYPGNPDGRWDAIQRDIRVNHLAIVDRARGGSTVRLRMDSSDSVMRYDADDTRGDSQAHLTNVVNGHQHLVSCQDWQGCEMASGETGCAVSQGADNGHSHPWVKDAHGRITIGESDAHTHSLIDDSMFGSQRADRQIDQSGPRPESGITMTQAGTQPTADEQIRLLTVRADEAERVATTRRDELETSRRDADGLRAELTTAKERIVALETEKAAGASAVETAALLEQKTRADDAESKLAELERTLPAKVQARANLIAKATAVLGAKFRADSLTEREIVVAAVRSLRAKEDCGPTVSYEYLTRRLDSLIEDRTANATSLARASTSLAMQHQSQQSAARLDAPQPNKQVPWNEQWKLGAGQYSTAARKGD